VERQVTVMPVSMASAQRPAASGGV